MGFNGLRWREGPLNAKQSGIGFSDEDVSHYYRGGGKCTNEYDYKTYKENGCIQYMYCKTVLFWQVEERKVYNQGFRTMFVHAKTTFTDSFGSLFDWRQAQGAKV